MISNPGVNVGLSDFCQQSLISNNVEAAVGGGSGETTEEIRMNTMAHFSAQQRRVTKNDYLIRIKDSLPGDLATVQGWLDGENDDIQAEMFIKIHNINYCINLDFINLRNI